MNKGNIFKAWFTSIMGCILIIAAIFLWFFGLVDIWQGGAAIILGVILLYAPKTIEKKVSEFIKAWGSKGDFGSGNIDIDVNKKYEDSGNKKTDTE